VWSTDLTYIRLARGFAYLVAVIDWYSHALRWSVKFFVSRHPVAWHLSISGRYKSLIIPRPPVDSDAAHSARLWTAA
jgi:hypothetical protein